MSKGLIIGLVSIGAIVLIFFMWGSSAFNSAVGYQECVSQAFGDVQAAYQRRADLIPNLVSTVKAAAENEKSILTQVTQARAGIVGAKTPEDLELAGKKINTAINLAFEAYPQIRSTENFKDLQTQLEGTENRISVARQEYNKAIKEYNGHIRGFFNSMFLNKETFAKKEGFKESAGSENAPKVEF